MIRTMLAMFAVLTFATAAQAETVVTLSDVHLCCGGCVKAVNAAVKPIAGANVAVNDDDKTVTVTAKDDATAQKAVDAIAEAGYYGKSDNEEIAVKPAANVPKGKVKRLELSGIHNCCGACKVAITRAVDKVDGVQANTVQAKKRTFVIEGDFSAEAVVAALNKAGFSVKVKK